MKTQNNYRSIYEQCFGQISKDENGRTYEIHHIDGDHSNNSPNNLSALSIEEHYAVHYSQGDWFACFLIGMRMKKSHEELSALLSGENNHNFDPTIYHLVHKTGESFIGTRQDFLKTNKTVKRCNFSLMSSGNAHSVQGWKLADHVIEKKRRGTGIDSNIYRFDHKDGTSFIGNRRDFVEVHNQNQGKISQLINGRISVTNGWRLVTNVLE